MQHSAVVSCACGLIILLSDVFYFIRLLYKFDLRLVINNT
jgi:hypothetical protein